MKQDTFISILHEFGFKQSECDDPALKVFYADSGNRKAILYLETWGDWVWIVGKDIPNRLTGHYPGGVSFYTTDELRECLLEN